LFSSSGRHELLGGEIKKLVLELDEIIENKDNKELIAKIEKHIAHYMDIKNFSDYGDDKKHDKDFEILCNMLQKNTQKNLKTMTVFEFYSLLEIHGKSN